MLTKSDLVKIGIVFAITETILHWPIKRGGRLDRFSERIHEWAHKSEAVRNG